MNMMKRAKLKAFEDLIEKMHRLEGKVKDKDEEEENEIQPPAGDEAKLQLKKSLANIPGRDDDEEDIDIVEDGEGEDEEGEMDEGDDFEAEKRAFMKGLPTRIKKPGNSKIMAMSVKIAPKKMMGKK